MKKFKVVVIGLGKQNTEDHLPAIIESNYVELDSVCDIRSNVVDEISKKYKVSGYVDLDKLLEERKIDIAVVAVPHNKYYSIIEKLARKKIHIIKEKPFAISLEEGLKIHNLIKENGIKMMITLQRRFNPIFKTFLQLKNRIGKIYSIEGKYTMNIDRLDEGWRAKKEIAGGGALIDMGYHSIDLLIWYFGLPDLVNGIKSIGNRENQNYNVEDTISFSFEYNSETKDNIMGNFLISRVYPKKEEKLTVYGSKGIIKIKRGNIKRLDVNGEVIESLTREGAWPSAAIEQIDFLAKTLLGEEKLGNKSYEYFFNHLFFIESIYKSIDDKKVISPKKLFTNIKL